MKKLSIINENIFDSIGRRSKGGVVRKEDEVKVEQVDLGLPSGTIWAAWNVGASSLEEYGDYYAWGETKPKDKYTWNTYKFGTKDNLIYYNKKDGKTILDPEDDVAHIVLGGKWHIPTEEQKTKMQSAKMIANKIANRLKEIVGDEDVVIGIEGFSYGSISSSTLDLALYNSFLRIKLLEVFGEDCLVIISPTEGKKTLFGKGNAKKEDMIQAFIENKTKDIELEKCSFWKFCNEQDIDYKYIKPIDDLVDSYGILKSI